MASPLADAILSDFGLAPVRRTYFPDLWVERAVRLLGLIGKLRYPYYFCNRLSMRALVLWPLLAVHSILVVCGFRPAEVWWHITRYFSASGAMRLCSAPWICYSPYILSTLRPEL